MARRPSQRPWRRRKNDWVADGVVVAVGEVFDCGGEEIGGGEDFEVPVAGAADAALVAGGQKWRHSHAVPCTPPLKIIFAHLRHLR